MRKIGAPLLLLVVELRALPVKIRALLLVIPRVLKAAAVARRVPALGLHALAQALAVVVAEELVGLGHEHPQRTHLDLEAEAHDADKHNTDPCHRVRGPFSRASLIRLDQTPVVIAEPSERAECTTAAARSRDEEEGGWRISC